MAGILNVDTLKADSNLKLQVASANVAFIDANGLTIVGNSLNVGGGKIVVTSNNSISTPTVIGANLVTVSGTTALGITANGQITTANAPFILTGGRIQFPATQVPSSDANTLDDYEEGTFLAQLGTDTKQPTVTYTSQASYYTKIGSIVFVEINLQWSSFTGGSGSATIKNLPFTTGYSSNDPRAFSYMFAWSGPTWTGVLATIPQTAGTSVLIYCNNNGTIGSQPLSSMGTSGGSIRCCFYYSVI